MSGYDAPLWDDLSVGGRLEYDFYRRADGDFVNRSAGQVGVHLDARVVVEGDDSEVERLILVEAGDGSVVHDAVVVYLAAPAHLLPFKSVAVPAPWAVGLGRVLKVVVAVGTALDDEPSLVSGFPEGSCEVVGYYALLYHVSSPNHGWAAPVHGGPCGLWEMIIQRVAVIN